MKKVYGVTNVEVRAARRQSPSYQALDQKKVHRRRRVLDRSAAREAGEVHGAHGPEADLRGFQNVAPVVDRSSAPALGSKFRQTVNAVSAKLTLHGDHRDEQGGRDRQAVAEGGRQGVPEGEPPDLGRSRGRRRASRSLSPDASPPSRRSSAASPTGRPAPSALPTTDVPKPHCGESASRSSGTKRAAASMPRAPSSSGRLSRTRRLRRHEAEHDDLVLRHVPQRLEGAGALVVVLEQQPVARGSAGRAARRASRSRPRRASGCPGCRGRGGTRT